MGNIPNYLLSACPIPHNMTHSDIRKSCSQRKAEHLQWDAFLPPNHCRTGLGSWVFRSTALTACSPAVCLELEGSASTYFTHPQSQRCLSVSLEEMKTLCKSSEAKDQKPTEKSESAGSVTVSVTPHGSMPGPSAAASCSGFVTEQQDH